MSYNFYLLFVAYSKKVKLSLALVN